MEWGRKPADARCDRRAEGTGRFGGYSGAAWDRRTIRMRDLSTMHYHPKTPDYTQVVHDVMRIFDTGVAENIEIGKRIEAADLSGQEGDPRLEEGNRIVIPAGTFFMGAQKKSPKGRNYDPYTWSEESPVHTVALHSFSIGRFPVTVQEFAKFMASGGYAEQQYWAEGFGFFREPKYWEHQKQYPNRPVIGVSWFEAVAYCSWVGGWLLTEAEWERAAIGLKGDKYPRGQPTGTQCVASELQHGHRAPYTGRAVSKREQPRRYH
jgi:formylglycine-generating enzyme required for sulfatase activity